MALNDLPNLPAPLPGSSADVRFRRLLHSCQTQLLAQRGPGSGSLSDQPATSAASGVAIKLKGFVGALQDQLADLDRSSAVPQATLDAYRQHVRSIATRLPLVELPPYCRNLGPSLPVVPRLPLAGVPFGGGGAGFLTGPTNLSTATIDKLTQHEHLQESLTSELADMASALKESTLGVQSAVRHRGQVLDRTEVALDDSLVRAQHVAARSKEQVKRGTGSLCLTLMILLFVCLAFTGMVVWIKFTSLLGMGRAVRRTFRHGEL